MEKYVVSRELAEKLKRAGYPQDKSILTWRQQQWSKLIWAVDARMFINIPQIAAPIADELLEQLRQYDWSITNLNSEDLSLTSESLNEPEGAILGHNFAEVLAELWLQLKEEGSI